MQKDIYTQVKESLKEMIKGMAQIYEEKAEQYDQIIKYIGNNEVDIVSTIMEKGEVTIKWEDIVNDKQKSNDIQGIIRMLDDLDKEGKIEEHITIVNNNDEEIGSATKEKANKLGSIRRFSRVLLFRKIITGVKELGHETLLQRRAKNIFMAPDTLDCSAGGSVLAGETYEQAAHRELKEELGIDVPLKEILYFKAFEFLPGKKMEERGAKRMDSFNKVFIGEYPKPVETLYDNLQKEEVQNIYWVNSDIIDSVINKVPKEFAPGFVLTWQELQKTYKKPHLKTIFYHAESEKKKK